MAGKDNSTLATQRRIQRRQDAKDAAAARKPERSHKQQRPAVQAGTRVQPEKLPAQHLAKPGHEAELELAAAFLAPDYRGSGKLDGFAAMVTGGDSGIGRAVAVLFAREGADVAVFYLDSHEDAERRQRCVEDEGRRCLLIAGDVKDAKFCDARGGARRSTLSAGSTSWSTTPPSSSTPIARGPGRRAHRTKRCSTNIGGYLRMARAALPHLKQRRLIINTGSVTGLKAAAPARLLGDQGRDPRVHQVAGQQPAGQRHPRQRGRAGPGLDAAQPGRPAGRQGGEFGEDTDMRRAAQPEELSPAYVFLASPVCAGYISGIVLPVTGSVGAI